MKKFSVAICLMLLSSMLFAQNGQGNPSDTVSNNQGVGSTRWKLTGNFLDSGKFIGTINQQDLIFKSNGLEGLRLTPNKDLLIPGQMYMDLHRPMNLEEKNFLTINYYGKIQSMDKSGLEKSLTSAIYSEPCKYMINLVNGLDYTIPSPVWASIPGFNGPGILWTGADCAPARVGIGTDSPTSSIDVRGGAYISGATSIGTFHNNTAMLFVDQSNPLKNGLTVELTTTSPTYTGAAINTIVNQNDRKAFAVYNSNYNTDVFRVLGNGTVWATEMHVRLKENFPDYVFGKDYKLLSLDSLENYISLNFRLPGMPSADQVKTSGLELGEMNRLLVEKVEELTLYMIELKKLIEEQQKKIEQLEENVN